MTDNIELGIEWVRPRLSELVTERKETSTGAEEVHSVSVHKGLVNQVEHLGRSYAAADTSNYNLVRPGDIVYTKSPTGDFPLGVVKRSSIDYDAIVSPLYGVFRPLSDDIGILIDKLFSNPDFSLRYLTPLVFKGAKNTINVTNTQFLEGRIPTPAQETDLKRVIAFIEASEREVRLLRRTADALALRNKGMMQRFLGKAQGQAA